MDPWNTLAPLLTEGPSAEALQIDGLQVAKAARGGGEKTQGTRRSRRTCWDFLGVFPFSLRSSFHSETRSVCGW